MEGVRCSSSLVVTAMWSFSFQDRLQDAEAVWKGSVLQRTNLHFKDALAEANKGVCSGEFITEKILL